MKISAQVQNSLHHHVLRQVSVKVSGEFGAEGEPGRNIVYSARVEGDASPEELEELIRHTDRVAEIQNTFESRRWNKINAVNFGRHRPPKTK
jgi:hypothetical protein